MTEGTPPCRMSRSNHPIWTYCSWVSDQITGMNLETLVSLYTLHGGLKANKEAIRAVDEKRWANLFMPISF
uniref:Uncharacterized protein n=1 Tax=Arundo donax TaxID=35708 RepID=A0A0A9DDT9_ARUDO